MGDCDDLKPCVLATSNSVTRLKFSIENILSPEFGRNNLPHNHNGNSLKALRAAERRLSDSDSVNHGASKPKKARCSFDISSLTGKRKHSSDSESSTTSSTFSTTSKESYLHSSISTSHHKISNHHHKKLPSPASSSSNTTSPVTGKTLLNGSSKPDKTSHESDSLRKENNSKEGNESSSTENAVWPPPWVFCTRYSDRPSSGKRQALKFLRQKSKLSGQCFTNANNLATIYWVNDANSLALSA